MSEKLAQLLIQEEAIKAQIEAEKRKISKVPKELAELADTIHCMLCNEDHEDKCDYYYERGTSRKKYINIANKFVEHGAEDGIRIEQLNHVLNFFKGHKWN